MVLEGEADRQLLADIKKQVMICAAELLREKGLISIQEELAMKAVLSREGKGEGNAAGGNL